MGIRKTMRELAKKTSMFKAKRKELYMQVPFKGDNKLVRTLRDAFAHTSPAATLGPRFNILSVISLNLKNKLSVLSSFILA